MQKKNLIFLIVSLIIIAGLSVGGYFVYKNYFQKVSNIANIDKAGLPGKLFGPKTAQKAAALDPIQVLYWTNKYRADNNLPALSTNSVLTSAAQQKVSDMFTKQYFEHVSPDGVSPADLVSAAGYNYKTTGENLALGDFKDEKDLVDAWMASPGHRANILNAEYTEIGIATGLDTFEDRGKTWLAVQEFGKPLPNCTKPDANILNKVNSTKTQYDSLVSQINTLSAEASNLNAQANTKIQQGNEIYTSTKDAAKAQPYWDEGAALRTQANANLAQAKTLQDQADVLLNEFQSGRTTYNSQVDVYNTCIKK